MEKQLIYIVEDDEGIAEVYDGAFEENYRARIFPDAESFFKAYSQDTPHLIILDIMLPDMDGYTILSKIRQKDERVPVIMVSAKNDEISFIKGLNKGADDYIAKPFSIMELLARVKAGLRRANLYVRNNGDFTIDNGNYRILYKGSDLKLTPKEFKLLRFIISRCGTAVSREELFYEGWGDTFAYETRALDMHIAEIRNKLTIAGGSDVIKTVRGIGYRID